MPSLERRNAADRTATGKALDGVTLIATSRPRHQKSHRLRYFLGFNHHALRADQKPAHRDPRGLLFAQDLAHADIKGNRNDKQADTGPGTPIRIAS